MAKPYLLAALSVPFAWCGVLTSAQADELQNPPIEIAVTFSVLGDLVKKVAGDDANVTVLTPINAEVHEWELTPDNFAALEDADIVFYNGYQLEQWMRQVSATVNDDIPMIAVAEASGYPTQTIVTGEMEGDVDPHLWMDRGLPVPMCKPLPTRWRIACPIKPMQFSSVQRHWKRNCTIYMSSSKKRSKPFPKSAACCSPVKQPFSTLPTRIGSSTTHLGDQCRNRGSPRQLMRVIDRINERQPAALFWESTISDRHVTSIARDTGLPVAGPLYVDSLSEPDGEAADYFAMQRHNVALLRRYLASE